MSEVVNLDLIYADTCYKKIPGLCNTVLEGFIKCICRVMKHSPGRFH